MTATKLALTLIAVLCVLACPVTLLFVWGGLREIWGWAAQD